MHCLDGIRPDSGTQCFIESAGLLHDLARGLAGMLGGANRAARADDGSLDAGGPCRDCATQCRKAVKVRCSYSAKKCRQHCLVVGHGTWGWELYRLSCSDAPHLHELVMRLSLVLPFGSPIEDKLSTTHMIYDRGPTPVQT